MGARLAEDAMKVVRRETDAEAIRLAKTLLRSSRHGALAVLDPENGVPLASRVAVATDFDGAPIILVSALSAHTAGLGADPRCSLLLGEPGKGDPLAHPRMTLICSAEKIGRDDPRHERIEWRFLSRNPKAKLYVGFGDFSFFRLVPSSASLNGGFGKAYKLVDRDLLNFAPNLSALAAAEREVVEQMNAGHADAIARLVRHFGKISEPANWMMSGIDIDGIDLIAGDRSVRIFFQTALTEPQDIDETLLSMSVSARMAKLGHRTR